MSMIVVWSALVGTVLAQDAPVSTESSSAEPTPPEADAPPEPTPVESPATAPEPTPVEPTAEPPVASPPASAPAATDPSPAPPVVVVAVDAAGRFYVDDQPTEPRELKRLVALRVAQGTAEWSVVADPAAPPGKDVAAVLRVLQNAGVDQPQIAVRPYAPPPSSEQAQVVAVAGQESPVRPRGEIHLDWNLERLGQTGEAGDVDGFSNRFSIPRAAIGFEAAVSPRLHTMAVIEAVYGEESDSTATSEQAEQDASSGTEAPAWSVRMRDVYADIQPFDTDAFWLRPGIQPTVVGSNERFNPDRDGYYLVGPRSMGIAVMSELVHERDLAILGHGDLFDDRLGLDLMVSSGAGSLAVEENNAKNLSGRVDFAAVDSFHVIASAEHAVHGPDETARDLTVSLMMEWQSERVRLMAEYLGGMRDADTTNDDSDRFVGGQTAMAIQRTIAGNLLDTGCIVGRLGYFDPQASTTDADAWLTADASLQAWWETRNEMGFMTGAGYGMWMPMNITLPLEHTVVLEVLWNI